MFEHIKTHLLAHYKHNPYVCISEDFNVFSRALDSINAKNRVIRCIGIFSQKELVAFIQSHKASTLITLKDLSAKQVDLELFLCDCESFLPPSLTPLQEFCQIFCFKAESIIPDYQHNKS